MTPNNEELPAAGAEAPVDFEQLRAASSEDHELLLDLVKLYFEQADTVMSGLQKATQERSASEVDYLAHKLVGASLACGMSGMVGPLRRLEMCGKNGNLEGADGLMVLAVSQLTVVRRVVDEYIRNGKTQ